MQMDMTACRMPALGLTEAALMRAVEPPREAVFVPVDAPLPAVQPDIRRGSAAGRAVLGARGIQLPGVAPMYRMARQPRVSVPAERRPLPVARLIAYASW